MSRYNPQTIEPKWQTYWEENRIFATPRVPPEGTEKFYVLDMFPYPSGDGLHVGHPEGYTATDIVCRTARMQGKSVMHPMGFDAFGLPAEEHAVKTGTHPRIQTERNMANFRRQLRMLGFSFDWERDMATTDLEYFRWTQWIFLKLYDTWFDTQRQRGCPIAELPIPEEVSARGLDDVRIYQDEYRLAYQMEAPVNWCPALGTVLANEEVIGGASECGQHPVVRLPMRQWMLRITAYADRLENDLESVDWPEGIKSLQRNWIGRSKGAEVDFYIGHPAACLDGRPNDNAYKSWKGSRAEAGFPRKADQEVLRIYTTRPDTLFGATYMVLAPEHPLVKRLTLTERWPAVQQYCKQAASKADLDRTDLAREKTGEFTGSYAVNPLSNRRIPIWIADYVLISYGTGAIMAVPAHDERDLEFARQYNLNIVPVVDPCKWVAASDREEILAGRRAFTNVGIAIQSERFDGLSTAQFKVAVVEELTKTGAGQDAINYKLRDWLFSRQRFWGEPFPLLHEVDDAGQLTGVVRPVSEDQLPVDLPYLEDFKPPGKPEPLLEKAPDEWLYVTLDGKRYKRETNTMPQWAGSCWYYLRFLDPKNQRAIVDLDVEKAWMPVDLYVGGAEHAVLHLLYARFWHKVLFDRGFVSTSEPFVKLVNQGMILGEVEFTGYQQTGGSWVSAREGGGEALSNKEVQAVRLAAADVEKQGDRFVLKRDPTIQVDSRTHKMSKTRGNVINPDKVVQEYGADALRLYEMFMGPLKETKSWNMDGVNGARSFLDRVWRLIVDEQSERLQLNSAVTEVEPTVEQRRVIHRTIKEVTLDIANMEFNTAIARMMEFTNYFMKQQIRPRVGMENLVLLLSPFAPHISEELWQVLARDEPLAYQGWPSYEESAIQEDTLEIPVQINGKVRSKVTISAGLSDEALTLVAREDQRIAGFLADVEIQKVVVVSGRLVNFVVKKSP